MTTDVLLFDRLENRYRIEADLEARTAFRIGRGREHDAVSTDLPLLKGAGDRLFVPGSTWKGVVRSAAEQLLRGMAPPEAWKQAACDPFGDSCEPAESRAERDALERASSADRIAAMRARAVRYCRACATFGAQGLASHVRFADTPVRGATTLVRDGVGMDRDLARAADGLKYDFEVVEPGATLTLTVELENVRDWQVGLVLAVLDDLAQGFVRVGGFTSRGLGWFTWAADDRGAALRLWRSTPSQVRRRQPGERLSDLDLFSSALDALSVEA